MAIAPKRVRVPFTGVLCGTLLLASSGCQTLSMSQDEWTKEQHGYYRDTHLGRTVETVGTVLYHCLPVIP